MFDHWSPFFGMRQLRRELDRLLDDADEPQVAGPRAWPPVNLYEDDEAVYVSAMAPGLDPRKIEVSVRDGLLTVAGERRALPEVPPEDVHRRERPSGSFVRAIDLGAEVDESGVTADYRCGLLMISLPKSAASRPKRIPITVA